MNEAENKVQQQIIEKVKSSTNILVTVNMHPSVDELSAALGLTIFLNKLGKHATAVFSGNIPPAINFLEPDKVFETKADSLRDFIIALDKEKADHLRYKIEGDLVKIFITPYRTTISEADLEFSQGDYNVELVLALGVSGQEHLDVALSSAEKILHDVTIATLSAGEQSSQLGSMDWRDETAGSLSEMVAQLEDKLKTAEVVLDKQIATCLLTGIVAATERFSNVKTTSKVMTVAAQLMAAGADQQLIATKLQDAHAIDSLPSATVAEAKKDQVEKAPELEPVKADPPDLLKISHEEAEPVEAVEEPKPVEPAPEPVVEPKKVPTINEIIGDVKAEPTVSEPTEAEPLLGGILSATSDQAAEDARRQLDEQQNKTILSHSYLAGSEPDVPPINGISEAEDNGSVDIFAQSPNPSMPDVASMPLPPPLPDFSTLPPVSTVPPIPAMPEVGESPSVNPAAPAVSTLPPAPAGGTDPGQFQIPM